MSLRFFIPANGSLRSSEHMQSATTDVYYATSELYTDYDKYALGTKIVYMFMGTIIVMFNILAITALRRAKKIPYACKLLCIGTLLFDLSFIVLSTARKFIRDPTTNLAFQVVGAVSFHLSLLSAMMMSVERYVLFYCPMRYLKKVTGKVIRALTFSTWILYIVSFLFVRYGLCYLKLRSNNVFQQAGVCNSIIVVHLGVCLLAVTTISCICNCKILKLIKSKQNRNILGETLPSTSLMLRFYKSTGLVLTSLIVLLLTSTVYAVILIAVVFFNLGVFQLRITFESISIANCSVDSILYMFWFKECQLELVKLLAFFNKRFYSTAEEMRIEIFGIVTSDSILRSRANDTEV